MGELSQEIQDCYPIWRLVFEGGQSLNEVKEWDLLEIWTANAILDMQRDTTDAYQEALKPERKDK